MKKINLLLVLLILFAVFFCAATGVASAISLSDKYVGNTVVDLEWSKYGSTDFSKYMLYRSGARIHTAFNRNTIFYRDEGPNKGITYNYKIEVYNATGGLVDHCFRSVTTGDVGGTITLDTTWTAASSPYTLTGGVTVVEDATLTIGNGVTVNSGSHVITVQGTLAPLDTVTWNGRGLYLSDVDFGYSIKNCKFNGSSGGFTGVYLKNCSYPRVENCDIYNYGAGIHIEADSPYVIMNDVWNITGTGIYVNGEFYEITDNTVTYSGLGIQVRGFGGIVNDNFMQENEDGGIQHDGGNESTFLDNTIEYGYFGMNIQGKNHTIEGNTIVNNSYAGIYCKQGLTESTVERNNITNNDRWGIYISAGGNNEFYNNTINNNYEGIWMASCPNSKIQNNNLSSNRINGISAGPGCDNLTITNNNAYNNYRGIGVQKCDDVEIMFNTITFSSGYGIYVEDSENCTTQWNTLRYNCNGIYYCLVTKGELSDNTLEENDLYGIWLAGVTDCNVSNHNLTGLNKTGLYLSYCHHLVVEHIEISKCKEGLRISGGDNVIVQNNTVHDCDYGIYGWSTFDNVTITENEIYENEVGIYLTDARGLLITKNELTENGDGTKMMYSQENEILENTYEKSGMYGIHIYQCGKNTIRKNTINGTTKSEYSYGACVFLERSTEITFEDNTLTNSSKYGLHIKAWGWDEDNTHRIIANTVKNNADHGINNHHSDNNHFERNHVLNNSGYGGILVKKSNECNFEYNTVEKNANHGFYFIGSTTLGGRGHTVTNNRIAHNGEHGIHARDIWESYIGFNQIIENKVGVFFSDEANNNTLHRNIIERDEADEGTWDIIFFYPDTVNNTVKETTLGRINPVNITLKNARDGWIHVRSVYEPPEDPKPPEYPFKRTSIKNHVEIYSRDDASITLWFHYTEEQLKAGSHGDYQVPEESLKVWRYGLINDTYAWRLGNEEGEEPWNGTRKLDTENNIVGVEIKKFSIFSPLAGLPVHNVNTGEDFNTIQEAIDDSDTVDGHTITVDKGYTEAETKENIVVDKKLTIKSTSGDTSDTVIEAADPGKHVIEVIADEVTIQGFTIKGATEGKAGVYLHGSTIQGCTISQNFITENKCGIHLKGAKSNAIQENVISGNTDSGMRLDGSGTEDNQVWGNYIGTNKDGTAGIPNKRGVYILYGAKSNTIGGKENGKRNIISGNVLSGVEIKGKGTEENKILGNCIGTDESGTKVISNKFGVTIWNGAKKNTIGGKEDGKRNIISGNTEDGVLIFGSETEENEVLGNYIGTNKDGTAKLPNEGYGVEIGACASDNWIGRYEGGGNVISGNKKGGVLIKGKETRRNEILGNYIGTNRDGTSALPNEGYGVELLDGPTYTRIGGERGEKVKGNIISGNKNGGVLIKGDTGVNWVLGNYIGTNKDGTVKLPNEGYGVEISVGPRSNYIGSEFTGQGNIISGNKKGGVLIKGKRGIPTGTTKVFGNYIGTNKDGTVKLPNEGYGLEMLDKTKYNEVTNNKIWYNCGGIKEKNSGPNWIYSNSIKYNTCSTGIHLDNSNSEIVGNTISGDGGDGIHCENGSNPLTNWNNIYNNTGYGLNNLDMSVEINARHNWWGNASGPGDEVSGNVDYDNWTESPVEVVPHIEVEKSVWDAEAEVWTCEIEANVGDMVRFRLFVHNDGINCSLSNIVVNDTLPFNLEYADNATVNGIPREPDEIVDNKLTWNFAGPLEACENITIEFDARVIDCGDGVNLVNATAWCEELQYRVRAEDSAAAKVLPSIEVEKDVWDTGMEAWVEEIHAEVGDVVTFQLWIHHDGTCCTISDIVVEDTLPEGLEFVSGEPVPDEVIQNEDNTTTVKWDLVIILEPCENTTVELVANVTKGGEHNNEVYANATGCGYEVSDTDEATVIAVGGVLDANFRFAPTEPEVCQDIYFFDETTGGYPPYSYQWDFNNDSTIDSTEKNPTWNYTETGNHTVSLKVNDTEGNTDTVEKMIIVYPAAPNITSFAPPSPVNDTVCNWRDFNVTVNQTVNVSWYLNDSLLFTNESVREANCTLHAEVAGEHNLSAIATNENGTDIQTWIWEVVSAGVFDTGSPANPYPSISGTHNGTITPNQTITVSKLYTYPCSGTGGHTEHVAFYYSNGTKIAEGHWTGYTGDWHNISFSDSFTLSANETYNYTLHTGSYPQIHHTSALPTASGWINCTEFVDANGRRYTDWIPAIRLE